jgi:hypothetical protein
MFNEFQTHAYRAPFVTFKAFPLIDSGMLEWWRRWNALGPVRGAGFSGAWMHNHHYRSITDEAIMQLQKEFGVTHAVLYLATQTALPELTSNATFRLVRIQQPDQF